MPYPFITLPLLISGIVALITAIHRERAFEAALRQQASLIRQLSDQIEADANRAQAIINRIDRGLREQSSVNQALAFRLYQLARRRHDSTTDNQPT